MNAFSVVWWGDTRQLSTDGHLLRAGWLPTTCTRTVCTSPNRILFTLPSRFPVSSTSSASTSGPISRFWTDSGRFPTAEAALLFCVRHVSVRRFWLWPSSREWLFTTAFPAVSRSPEGPEEGWPFPDTRAWDPSREESLGCNFKPFQREKSYITMFGFTEYDILIEYSLTTKKK